ncbi:hypothetical protein [Candidatus Avelusimicrobium sp.]
MKNQHALLYDMLTRFTKTIKSKQCVFPSCTNQGKIISAHSIQKNGPLAQIANNGNIYQIQSEITNGEDNLRVCRVGIKKASAHHMFCEQHEQMFSAIENNKFQIIKEHIFLASLRSLMMELYKKNLVGQFFNKNSKNITTTSFSESFLNEYISALEFGKNDIDFLITIYLDALSKKSYDNFKYLVLEFPSPIGIVSAGAIHITSNFTNTVLLQDLVDNNAKEILVFSCVSVDKKVYFIFHYPASYKKCQKFMDSFIFLPAEERISYLVQFFFNRCENTFFSYTFWEKLSEDQKNWLLHLANPQTEILYDAPRTYKKDFYHSDISPKIHINQN